MNVKTKRGFTLIELMIVVAIIGILAAIAIPKFSQLVTKSNEASTKGNLGAVRSALSIYYGDMEGWYPSDSTLASLTTNAKYLTTIPVAKVPAIGAPNPGHGDSNAIAATSTLADAAGWQYNNVTTDSNWGRFIVACTHVDLRGNVWTTY